MDTETILAIISTILGITGVSLGIWVKRVRNSLLQGAELLMAVSQAMEDNTITAEEKDRIIKEAKEFYNAVRGKE